MTESYDAVPTPFGDGVIEVDEETIATLTFTGKMSKEALDWAITSGPEERSRFTSWAREHIL